MISSRLYVARRTLRSLHGQRYLSQSSRGVGGSALAVSPLLGAAVLVMATTTLVGPSSNPVALDSRPIRGGDVVSVGTPTKEPATGILFPQMCNGYYLAGVGHRVKYVFVKVYGVACYFDPLAMSAVKNNPAALEQALLDPTYPRTIQIVMARGLSADKFTAGIVESLEPRMKGKDLDKLEEFKKMNPAVDLVQGEYTSKVHVRQTIGLTKY